MGLLLKLKESKAKKRIFAGILSAVLAMTSAAYFPAYAYASDITLRVSDADDDGDDDANEDVSGESESSINAPISGSQFDPSSEMKLDNQYVLDDEPTVALSGFTFSLKLTNYASEITVDDPSILEISGNAAPEGTMTLKTLKAGKTAIHVSGAGKTQTFQFEVYDGSDDKIVFDIDGFDLNGKSVNFASTQDTDLYGYLYFGTEECPIYSIYALNAEVTFSDNAVAFLDRTGQVKTATSGETDITLRYGGRSFTGHISVGSKINSGSTDSAPTLTQTAVASAIDYDSIPQDSVNHLYRNFEVPTTGLYVIKFTGSDTKYIDARCLAGRCYNEVYDSSLKPLRSDVSISTPHADDTIHAYSLKNNETYYFVSSNYSNMNAKFSLGIVDIETDADLYVGSYAMGCTMYNSVSNMFLNYQQASDVNGTNPIPAGFDPKDTSWADISRVSTDLSGARTLGLRYDDDMMGATYKLKLSEKAKVLIVWNKVSGLWDEDPSLAATFLRDASYTYHDVEPGGVFCDPKYGYSFAAFEEEPGDATLQLFLNNLEHTIKADADCAYLYRIYVMSEKDSFPSFVEDLSSGGESESESEDIHNDPSSDDYPSDSGGDIGYYDVNKRDTFNTSVSLSKTTFTYNGKNQTPKVTVSAKDGKNLHYGVDYRVIWPLNKKSPGKKTVKVQFRGNYKGSFTKTYKILPKNTKITKVKSPSKGRIKVSWKKQTGTGYQVQFSTDKKFKKNVYTGQNFKSKIKKAGIRGLKSKKTYYVRVRTMGGSAKSRVYSKWSKVKKIKVK